MLQPFSSGYLLTSFHVFAADETNVALINRDDLAAINDRLYKENQQRDGPTAEVVNLDAPVVARTGHGHFTIHGAPTPEAGELYAPHYVIDELFSTARAKQDVKIAYLNQAEKLATLHS